MLLSLSTGGRLRLREARSASGGGGRTAPAGTPGGPTPTLSDLTSPVPSNLRGLSEPHISVDNGPAFNPLLALRIQSPNSLRCSPCLLDTPCHPTFLLPGPHCFSHPCRPSGSRLCGTTAYHRPPCMLWLPSATLFPIFLCPSRLFLLQLPHGSFQRRPEGHVVIRHAQSLSFPALRLVFKFVYTVLWVFLFPYQILSS